SPMTRYLTANVILTRQGGPPSRVHHPPDRRGRVFGRPRAPARDAGARRRDLAPHRRGGPPVTMRKQVVHTPKVPPARVPLSQAIRAGDWVFASGQLGHVAPGQLAPGGIAAETQRVCENLKAVLEAGGSSLDRVVKVTIYMVDLGELMEMNRVFS